MMNNDQPYVTEANIKLIIPNISKLDEVSSPKYLIQDLQWKLTFSKRVDGTEPSLAVFLNCTAEKTKSDWSQAAHASITLLSSNGGISLQYNIEPYVYNQSKMGFGTTSLVSWKNLFDTKRRFVKEDKITLEIQILTEDVNERSRSQLVFDPIGKSCDDACLTIFRLSISNINNLIAVRSPRFQFGKLPWDFTVLKGQSELIIRLIYGGKEVVPYEIVMTATLLSAKEKKTVENCVAKNPTGVIRTKLILWEDLIDPQKGFINDNSIVIEIEMKKSGLKLTSCLCTSACTKTKLSKCPICFEVLQQQEISTTKCGHIFCSTCIALVVADAKPCPMCNAAVSPNDLLRIYLPL